MEIFQAIVLGAIQGLTEFLPISSSAHLIIVPWLADWEPFGLAFDVALHIGTLVAILAYFRRELVTILQHTVASLPELAARRWPASPDARMGISIALGTIPAAVAGVLMEGTIDRFFHGDPLPASAIMLIAAVLMIMGLVLAFADRRLARLGGGTGERQITLRQALLIGLAQSLALLPGASRSGTTITAGLLAGLSRPAAARFSFLLGVPLIAGAGLKQGIDIIRDGGSDVGIGVFVAGMATAGVVGYLAIAGLLRFLQRRSVDIFVLYRLGLGLTLLGLLAGGVR
ncbi:MAG: undecaprenyl-diphosphatase UppP [Chloroflexota bacterium]